MALYEVSSLVMASSNALRTMMPREVSNPYLDITHEVRQGIDSARCVVKGRLPSGTDWQFPLDIDMQAIYYAAGDAWLASTELASELRKACDAFKAMVALDSSSLSDGFLPQPYPGNPFKISERITSHGDLAVTLAVNVPNGAERITISLATMPNGTIQSYNEICAGGPSHFCQIELQCLYPKTRYVLYSLTVYTSDGRMAFLNHFPFSVAFETGSFLPEEPNAGTYGSLQRKDYQRLEAMSEELGRLLNGF